MPNALAALIRLSDISGAAIWTVRSASLSFSPRTSPGLLQKTPKFTSQCYAAAAASGDIYLDIELSRRMIGKVDVSSW